MFGGVPVPLGEAIWFTLAGLLVLAARHRALPYLFLIAIPAVSVVLFQAYVSVLILGTVSVLSLLSYTAVVAMFAMSGTATTPLAGLPREVVHDARAVASRRLVLGVAVLFLLASIAAVRFFSRTVGNPAAAVISALAQQPTDFDLWFESQVRAPAAMPAGTDRILILKFTDYQCEACAESHQWEHSVLAKHLETSRHPITLIVKHYPQDRECNAAAGENHEAACEAAAAVRLAQLQQRGSEMEEWLYSQQALTPQGVRQAAGDVGKVADFDGEYPRALAHIREDIDLARQLGVTSLPTIFVNGVKMEGRLRAEFLDQAITHELRVAATRQ